ncbi:sensor histidine kinase [Lutispora saccharofermentans]|uniref:sensor histidine kinase n=1 Tax=Lutispora saccharofermentans TaxID=3024236 RepID=UPI0026F20482|nr:ATP-binding protein [Lutispora saccharofermentans]
MKKSGYRIIFHIYLIFFLSLLGAIIASISLFYLLITVQTPGGSTIRSDWPKTFTEDFREQIIFIDDKPQVKQAGIELLQENSIGLQISASDTILQIIVSDNGKGMTAEETGSLFQRYYRGTNTEHKPEGTGLGLAITKSIVELHGGTISVSSIPGIGTAFQIQLPRT